VALRRESWFDEPANVGNFLGRIGEAITGVFGGYKQDTPADPAGAAEDRIATASQVTEDEARWLLARLQRDGKLHENEKVLLSFLRENSAHIHPVLRPALEQA
jgi:hypothetical protein